MDPPQGPAARADRVDIDPTLMEKYPTLSKEDIKIYIMGGRAKGKIIPKAQVLVYYPNTQNPYSWWVLSTKPIDGLKQLAKAVKELDIIPLAAQKKNDDE
ncbi:predicted protein [Plenodomus lingam JN3]|uniref:Predicted protein n=2 Tax=Leptosphaeria maculans TaxID=5022 RepID=E5ADY8_LEPMJ|nr:predicted protein [Plenodomus lingam JN3]CBY01427.1 predicted protein [Plenodomus lingam JN3]